MLTDMVMYSRPKQWLLLLLCVAVCRYTEAGYLEDAGQTFNDHIDTITGNRAALDGHVKDVVNSALSLAQYVIDHQLPCTDGMMPLFGRCYKFVKCTTYCNSLQAQAACEAMNAGGVNAYLASVKTQAINDKIVAMLPNRYVHVGGTDAAVEGEWRWRDGTLMHDGCPNSYQNWLPNHPASSTSINCMCINKQTTKWQGLHCSTNVAAADGGYVCEKLRFFQV